VATVVVAACGGHDSQLPQFLASTSIIASVNTVSIQLGRFFLRIFLAALAAVLAWRWARYATFRRRTFQEAASLTFAAEWEVPEP
jgi:hypothetical protein